MDFSKTFYSSKNKLLLSKNIFGNYLRDNKSAKKLFYITNYKNYNSYSTSPTNNSSKNCITKNTLKSINKLMSERIERHKEIKTQLKTFYKEEIKTKIRKSNKYRSLFEKTEISNSSKNELEKNLINLKLKSNKKKFSYIITNANKSNSNNININTYTNLNASNTSKSRSKTNEDISKINNIDKSKTSNNKSLNLFNVDNITKTHLTTTYLTKKSNDDKNPKETIRNKIYKNIFDKNIQNNQRHPPFSVDFREKNLTKFYTQTKSLCYQKYCLRLQKNKLEEAKMKSDLISAIGDLEYSKYVKFYQLFKPFASNFERYLIFLKETIYKEFKEKERLKLIKAALISDVIILKKNLLNMHKTLKSYIDDKFFLLCVKNSTLNLENFSEKYKTEFKRDLQNLETLKNYISDISELTSDENLIGKNKKILELNIHKDNKENDKHKKKEINFATKIQKIRDDFEKSFYHGMEFDNLFESTEEFIYRINSSQTRIEALLKKGNKVEIEKANMIDFVLHHFNEIEKVKEDISFEENRYNKYIKDLNEAKKMNKFLMEYKNKIIKTKNYNISYKVLKKLKSVIKNIANIKDKSVNEILVEKNKKKKEIPYYMLKNLENAIIFLINFKEEQKIKNNFEYSKIMKIIEKNNRLSVIEQKKEEVKIKNENKLKEIIQKNLKVFLNKDKRTCIDIKPLKNIKDDSLNKNQNNDDEKSIDIFY